jgi:hypothetical protein
MPRYFRERIPVRRDCAMAQVVAPPGTSGSRSRPEWRVSAAELQIFLRDTAHRAACFWRRLPCGLDPSDGRALATKGK